MRYTDLFEEQAPGTYVGVRFSPETVAALTEFQKANDIPNPLSAENFHTTVIYSREPIAWEARDDLGDEDCATKGWEVFVTKDKSRCLVLLLDSLYLQSRFDVGIERGATHDFPDYKPHITLSYDIGTFDIKKLPEADFDIELSHEYVEDLDTDWAKKS